MLFSFKTATPMFHYPLSHVRKPLIEPNKNFLLDFSASIFYEALFS